MPYTVNKSALVERIGEIAAGRNLPPLLDVKDVSTDDVRIALELKKDADEKMVMAYLFKHTPLQTSFVVNLTCLIPTENPEIGRPERLDLHAMLWHFLHFRLEVVTKRLEHELQAIRKRVHILEGFEKVFDALDEILKIVRKSDGKADAAQQIMKRFELDAEQTDAILELKIYRLARLEILIIRKELEEKRRRARNIMALLKDEPGRWGVVKVEIEEIQKKYGDARRTAIASDAGEAEYTAEDFIVEEDNVVIVSRDGWVKRQKEVKDVVDDARARRRQRAGGAPRKHACLGGLPQQLRRRLHRAAHRHSSVDRLRRADTALLQAEGRREDRRGAQPRPAGDRRHRRKEGRRRAAGARGRRHERRLLDAVRPRAVRRAKHPRRPALRAHGGRRGSRRRRPCHGQRDPHRRDARSARHPLQGRRGQLPFRARAVASSSSSSIRRATACSVSSPRPAIAT